SLRPTRLQLLKLLKSNRKDRTGNLAARGARFPLLGEFLRTGRCRLQSHSRPHWDTSFAKVDGTGNIAKMPVLVIAQRRALVTGRVPSPANFSLEGSRIGSEPGPHALV